MSQRRCFHLETVKSKVQPISQHLDWPAVVCWQESSQSQVLLLLHEFCFLFFLTSLKQSGNCKCTRNSREFILIVSHPLWHCSECSGPTLTSSTGTGKAVKEKRTEHQQWLFLQLLCSFCSCFYALPVFLNTVHLIICVFWTEVP